MGEPTYKNRKGRRGTRGDLIMSGRREQKVGMVET